MRWPPCVPRLMSAGLVLLGAACATETAELPGAQPAATTGSEVTGLPATVSLVYRRPIAFNAVTVPEGFKLIRDYRNSSATENVAGVWNDQTQTLTATVTVGIQVENLVYIVDDALAPEAETPIAMGHTPLREVVCPRDVPIEHACYLLQVLH